MWHVEYQWTPFVIWSPNIKFKTVVYYILCPAHAQPMPSPCPVCPMSYKRKICGVLGINGLHSSLGVQINSFLLFNSIFFLFLGFSVFPYLHALVTGDLSLSFILIGGFGFSVRKYTGQSANGQP